MDIPFFSRSLSTCDKALIINEDTLYELSLKIEPRLPACDPTLPRVRGMFMESRADRTAHAMPPAVLRGQGDGGKACLLCSPKIAAEPNQNSVSSQEAQLVGIKDRCFRLGWEAEESGVW